MTAQGFALRDLREDPASIPPELHQTTWCTDRAIDFISEKRRKGPWLMSVNVFDPHAPFDPPQEYLDRYDPAKMPPPLFSQSDLTTQAAIPADFQNPARPPQEFNAQEVIAAYYAMIELIDENIGRLLDALEETEQRDNTVFIFTSDHGEMLGDHGLLLKGCRFYEGLVRVPLIISWPAASRRRKRRRRMNCRTKTAPPRPNQPIQPIQRTRRPQHPIRFRPTRPTAWSAMPWWS